MRACVGIMFLTITCPAIAVQVVASIAGASKGSSIVVAVLCTVVCA